ncbi:class I SAM-dependent methyltransferase [Halalkalibacterium halodurans]|uniref:BH2051 protein n=2 Tax=Halalkalibacterium halodurans TaxID=86665 RepID=Q9KB77_HALH5|nr:class I SAM-dependent methyltransferase [Halalkalibacterium halodurans]MED4080811.1 class I SAM-dependent methyltransferase [Halalkalibacterium halodurans]MED4086055.1 class I SAM-dependent methyltransferase [Halalkalibacterium halodurans]MED4106788.1 class I SAM-dependent methyltransferase [Halalkalibacterium halodurans]MED4109545.1 class I SAM-dependent methyltransferase [Halalkalibacterium halodurans]MED4126358.1 class I SAM-dependent methyltransferase [Halalkalibacterium halodurans]
MESSYGEIFASLYNQKWSSFALQAAPRILQYFTQHDIHEKNKKVLDLCCGTGHLAYFFLKKEYDVTGIDLSPGMLHYAKKNNSRFVKSGQANFIEGDVTNFTLDEQFGLVVSTFDALNHLPDIKALRECFKCVYHVTSKDGIFIFDLNTKQGLKGWTNIVVEDNEDSMIVSRSFYDEHTARAITNMTGFTKQEDGLYKRFVHSVHNCAFELKTVKETLLAIGWQQVHFARLKDLSSPLENPEGEGRVFIVAKK